MMPRLPAPGNRRTAFHLTATRSNATMAARNAQGILVLERSFFGNKRNYPDYSGCSSSQISIAQEILRIVKLLL
jgi:hypothetical protein